VERAEQSRARRQRPRTSSSRRRKAAEYYLIAQNICNDKGNGCAQYDKSARRRRADFATNGLDGATVHESEGLVAPDRSRSTAQRRGPRRRWPEVRTHTGLARTRDGWGPSYLDRYKFYIASHVPGAAYPNLKKRVEASVLGYHPWHDVNSYIDSSASCPDYEHCANASAPCEPHGHLGSGGDLGPPRSASASRTTRSRRTRGPSSTSIKRGQIALRSDTRAGSASPRRCSIARRSRAARRSCAQLTALSTRFRRIYYMFYGLLERRAPQRGQPPSRPPSPPSSEPIDGAGLRPRPGFESTYSNPIYPHVLPRRSERARPRLGRHTHPTEGCPDPQGMRAHDGPLTQSTARRTRTSGPRYGGFPSSSPTSWRTTRGSALAG